MSALNPQVKRLSSGKIQMTWTPDPSCFGYRFYKDSVAVAKSSNPLQASTTFADDGGTHVFGIGRAVDGQPETVAWPTVPQPKLGELLLAAWPPPPSPNGGVFRINSFDEFMNAWRNPKPGADYDGQGKTFSGPAGDYFYRANPAVPPRFRNAAIVGGARLLVGGGSNVSLGNTMKEPLRISGGAPDCLKFDAGSKIYWDGLILEDSPGQGLLAGSGSAPAVTEVRGVNWITRRNGHNANKDHGAYLAHLIRFMFANWLSYDNQAYAGQFYPQAQDGLVVNTTGSDTGSNRSVRGGFVFGTEAGNTDPTARIRNIGCMSTFAPGSPGWDRYVAAPDCTVEDSQGWANAGGDVAVGLAATNVLHADPLFVDRANGDFRPRSSVVVRDINLGWLYPTDLYGEPRGPHAGAIAVVAP